MISTSVTVVRPPKADLDILSSGLDVLARATRMVFARGYQQGEDAARTKREICARMGMLARHYSGCRADVIAAVKGWRERLKEQRIHLRSRLAQIESQREKDYEKKGTYTKRLTTGRSGDDPSNEAHVVSHRGTALDGQPIRARGANRTVNPTT